MEQRLGSGRKPLKVVQLIPQDSLGGAETAAREMACKADLACDFRLISLAGELIAPGQQRMIGLGYGNPLNPFAQLAAVQAVLANDPDILICSLWKVAPAAIVAKLRRRKLKLVAFFHSARRVHLLDRMMHWLVLRFADAIWADSQATLDSTGLPRRNASSRVVSFVIDGPSAGIVERRPSPRFVSWSRIHNDKGMDRAIDLIALLVSRGIDAQFDLWGPDQGPREALLRQADRLGVGERIRFHGPVSRTYLPAVASEASFLLQLSRQEGMAMVVVEAMQMGLVPVVTSVGEMGRYCGSQNAIVVDPERLEFAADQLAALLDDPDRYAAQSKAARATWSDRRLYSDDVCAAAMELAGLSG